MKVNLPKIDDRGFSEILDTLIRKVPRYTPEWKTYRDDSGYALLNAFSQIAENVITRLNQAPKKNFVAFLNMLGINLLPAQSSRVPVTFELAKGAEKDVLIPERTQVVADKTDQHDEFTFETESQLWGIISKLKEVISVNPKKDEVYVHTSSVIDEKGELLLPQPRYDLFSGTDVQEHALYLGHKSLFNLDQPGNLFIDVNIASAGSNTQLDLSWEYWGENPATQKDGWIPFQINDDQTNGLQGSGRITLYKTVNGKVKEDELAKAIPNLPSSIAKSDTGKTKSRWIRCLLKTKLTTDSNFAVPSIDTLVIRADRDTENKIDFDNAFYNSVPLEVTPRQVSYNAEITSDPRDESATISPHSFKADVSNIVGFAEQDEVEVKHSQAVDSEPSSAKAKITKLETSGGNVFSMTMSFQDSSFTPKKDDTIELQKNIEGIYPFGRTPRLYDAFYLGSQDAFSKKGANISIFLQEYIVNEPTTPTPIVPDPKLSWEYWNGDSWQKLTAKDETIAFTIPSKDDNYLRIDFSVPYSMQETSVNGQKNYWIRARLVAGDYGRDFDYKNKTYDPKYTLPVIKKLKISYTFDNPEKVEQCFTFNNLSLQNEIVNVCEEGNSFDPFQRIADSSETFYMGFDKPLQGGPIRIFFAAKELAFEEEKKPKIDWTYNTASGWRPMDYSDETEGFTQQGVLEFSGRSDAISSNEFGNSLNWTKGSLIKGVYKKWPQMNGIYPNTTWAIQATTIKEEVLGSSDGEENQRFRFTKFPVLDESEIRVREVLSEEERQKLKARFGENVLKDIKDLEGNVTETWVLWVEVSDFFSSESQDRHYSIDRASGWLSFGDGRNGMIPNAGIDNIRASSYRWGGGKAGNVNAGEIKSIKTAVASVEKASNPIAADGGADTAKLEEMLEIGPSMIANRNRAISPEGYEFLAKQASRKIVKAKCLANTNTQITSQTGWVYLIIVPDSKDAKPYPSIQLRRITMKYLADRAPNSVIKREHLFVAGPDYLEISVSVDVFVASIDFSSEVERAVRKNLEAFLHPLTGGSEGTGWEFGREVCPSDIYSLLERIENLDHVKNLKISAKRSKDASAPILLCRDPNEFDLWEEDIGSSPGNFLVTSGNHNINIQLFVPERI